MVDSNGSSAPSRLATGNGSLLKMNEIAARFNLHPNTIRKATNLGRLTCYTMPSGHRRFAESDVLAWLGVAASGQQQEEHISTKTPIFICCRVSTDKQNALRGPASTESDLDRQLRRCEEYVDKRWGGENVAITRFVGVGSGLNFSRVQLLKMIEAILAGQCKGGFVVATYKDRVARFGVEMIDTICRYGQCQLVFTEAEPAKEVYETIAEDVLGILTHYTAKASGLKTRKALKVVVPGDVLQDCWKWKQQGLSYRAIELRLRKEGRNKDIENRPITYHVVRNCIMQHYESLKTLSDDGILDQTSNSFSVFYHQRIKQGDPSLRLPKAKLVEAYGAWCQLQGVTPLSNLAVGRWMKINNSGPTKMSGTGTLVYTGIQLEGAE